MKIECTVEELKELLKKEHTECKSECFNVTLELGSEQLNNEIITRLASRDKVQEGLA